MASPARRQPCTRACNGLETTDFVFVGGHFLARDENIFTLFQGGESAAAAAAAAPQVQPLALRGRITLLCCAVHLRSAMRLWPAGMARVHCPAWLRLYDWLFDWCAACPIVHHAANSHPFVAEPTHMHLLAHIACTAVTPSPFAGVQILHCIAPLLQANALLSTLLGQDLDQLPSSITPGRTRSTSSL